jgi:anti-sigma B factor antagonist
MDGTAMDFAVEWRFRTDGVRLAVVGELDVATAPALADSVAVALDADRRVVLDLGRLTFIDAAGLGALVAAHRYAADRGAVLELVAVPARARRLFAITGLQSLLGE